MKKVSYLLLAALVGLTALTILTLPRIQDAPEDISAQVVTIEGKRLLLVSGSNSDAVSAMSVVRIYSHEPYELRVDVATAPLVLSGSVISRFPVILDLDKFGPGDWTLVARHEGTYHPIARWTTINDNPRRIVK